MSVKKPESSAKASKSKIHFQKKGYLRRRKKSREINETVFRLT
ncbi:Uncharacterised protein [Sphingobacterium mizutaii]|uniref:Uncharacterized protein n=1 Tax=Sphingobacterium mizutaii TaxID=1010 RepID=A0AAJ5BZG6_9SPHI|nr:hypothetical protein SAMN05192578_10122 [Sphingobacterium mizutaii]SNV45785.1 Uncharacterised protein [Sphingobacterium mizutaii]